MLKYLMCEPVSLVESSPVATRENTVPNLCRHCLGGQAKTKDKESQSGDLREQNKLLLLSPWLIPILLGFRYQQLMGQQ